MTARSSYRSRIYERYASKFQDYGEQFNPAAARRWGKAYDYYFRSWLPDDSKAAVLDVGCGGGRLLHFLKERRYARISGVDISPEQIQLARQVSPQVEESDAVTFLMQRPEAYDLIIGLDIVEHFDKDEAITFLDACYGALKPHGRLILQTPNADSPWGTTHRYNDFTHEIG